MEPEPTDFIAWNGPRRFEGDGPGTKQTGRRDSEGTNDRQLRFNNEVKA